MAGRTGARERIEGARGWLLLAAALALLGLAIVATRMMGAQGRQLTTQQAQITALAGGLSTAEAQLEAHGISPIPKAPSVIVSEIVGPPGPGPSDSQVENAVDAYLEAHPPTANVDPAVLAETVDVYLSEHPPSAGPPPASEVAADVAAYLATNPPPSGPAGPQGSPGVGQQGPPGPAGQNGAPGSPPAGWSWTDPQGDTYDCAEDGQTPAPHYTCSLETPPASASPSPPASPTPTGTGTATGAATSQGGQSDVNAAAMRHVTSAPATPGSPTPTPSRVPLVLVLLRREDVPL